MVRWNLIFPAALVGALTLQAVAAANEGDADAGRELAARWCSGCHNIEPDGPMKQQPPAFAAIVVYRSPDYIRSNIMVPHSGMPEVAQILGLELDDLMAFMMSLKRP